MKKNLTQDESVHTNADDATSLVQSLAVLSGEAVMKRILDQDAPARLIRKLPGQDFYWLVKKVGDDDCLPLLRMATDEQKDHLIDLEFWKTDRFDMEKADQWMKRFYLADPGGLARYLFKTGEPLAFFYLVRAVLVEIRSDDEEQDLEGKFTVDGIHYVTVSEDVDKETLMNVLKAMAAHDLERYHALLLSLPGVIPAELEEEMYRMKNVRLAEYGFLPPEEAVAVYSRLKPERLVPEGPEEPAIAFHPEEVRDLVAVSPLLHAGVDTLLSRAVSGIEDPLLMDRVRIEFAGLCNRIIAADGIRADDLEILINICRKASGHLNIALEKVCGEGVPMARKILANNSLPDIFRVGFGLVLELKWETERWLKTSWFRGCGLGFDFWGEDRAARLKGITALKPMRYAGPGGETGYRYFEHLGEITAERTFVNQLKALDHLFRKLTETFSFEAGGSVTYNRLLLRLWARKLLNLEPGFKPVSLEQVRTFFRLIRKGQKEPPFRMSDYKDVFLKDFAEDLSDAAPVVMEDLTQALADVFELYAAEYAYVTEENLDDRLTAFF